MKLYGVSIDPQMEEVFLSLGAVEVSENIKEVTYQEYQESLGLKLMTLQQKNPVSKEILETLVTYASGGTIGIKDKNENQLAYSLGASEDVSERAYQTLENSENNQVKDLSKSTQEIKEQLYEMNLVQWMNLLYNPNSLD